MRPRTRWYACILALALGGCASKHAIIASTATTIGVELGTNAGNATPTGVLGYRRGEFAYVPTNRSENGGNSSNVKDVANVLMELSYGGTLSSNGKIYQRLAVGTEAVQGTGATVLFARKDDGSLNPEAADAIVMARTTLNNVDKIVRCTASNGKVDSQALKNIVQRALQNPDDKPAVSPFATPLQQITDEKVLRPILTQSDTLAQALARHVSAADCVSQ